MSRKPIHLEAQGPKGDRQAIWEAIRALHQYGGPINAPVVRKQLHQVVPPGRVRDYMVALEKGGYLTRKNPDAPRHGTPVDYRLTRDVGVEAPRVRKDGTEPTQGRGREQLWRTLRIIGDFSAAQLADAASTPAVAVAELTAAEYCQFLEAAGYLRLTRPGGPGVVARYQLVPSRWSGPRPPMIQRVKQLYDPNLGEVVYTREPTSSEGGQP